MTEREWILFKNSQLEMCFVIRQAQVTARWCIVMTNATIAQAQQKRITFYRSKS